MSLEPCSSPTGTSLAPVRRVPSRWVIRWVRLGWRDFRQAGWPSLLHGLIVAFVSLAIVEIAFLHWPLLPGAVSGFVLVGPILATGLYALSRCLEHGVRPRVRHAVDAWSQGSRCLFRFGLLLVLIGTAWVAVSALLLHFFCPAKLDQPLDFLRYVLTQGNGLFLLWTVLGGMVSAVVFAVTVVSVPLLVDRDVKTPLALLTSARAVGENPFAMLWWALFIMFATGLSIATLMLGFLVLYPLMGHASWHVYRDLVDASALPPRGPSEGASEGPGLSIPDPPATV